MILQRSSSSTSVQMDIPHGGPRLTPQISIKDRSTPSRPELCLHSIPVVLVLCFLLLWIVSSEIESPKPTMHNLVATSKKVALAANSKLATAVPAPPHNPPVIAEKTKHLPHLRGKRKLQHRPGSE